jgi:hypothetical protein
MAQIMLQISHVKENSHERESCHGQEHKGGRIHILMKTNLIGEAGSETSKAGFMDRYPADKPAAWLPFNAASTTVLLLLQLALPATGQALDFIYDSNATVYYLPGTTGWGPSFGGCPTAFWVLPNPVILSSSPSFGIQTNGFSLISSWATNTTVVVEACTNLANPTWFPLQTNTLTGGSSFFSDPQWTNQPQRFYRVRGVP